MTAVFFQKAPTVEFIKDLEGLAGVEGVGGANTNNAPANIHANTNNVTTNTSDTASNTTTNSNNDRNGVDGAAAAFFKVDRRLSLDPQRSLSKFFDFIILEL